LRDKLVKKKIKSLRITNKSHLDIFEN